MTAADPTRSRRTARTGTVVVATAGARLADPDAPISATELLWEFFQRHPLRR